MTQNKTKQLVTATAAAFLLAMPFTQATQVLGWQRETPVAYAAKGDLGVDNSVYQGTLGNLGSPLTKFNIIQVGGIYNNSVIYQSTYATQVQYTIAQGKRAHSYVFLADGSNQARTQTYMTQMLNKVQTPKGSIVAIDYESGATSNKEANTANILLAMDMVKQAGYTPMLYSYRPYLQANVNTDEVLAKYSNSIWIASYKTTARQTKPDFNYFPSFNGVNIWQFADNYGTNSSGVDGNVDMLGITDKGYDGTTTSNQGGTAVKPDTSTPAISAGQAANNTPKSDIKAGDTVKVNFSATKWATGQSIPSWVKGQSYKVSAVNGNKLLLSGIMSWINKSDAEILSVGTPVKTSTSINTSVDSLGVTWHKQSGTFTTNRAINLRWGARTSSAKLATLSSGTTIKYDQYAYSGGYVWVRQPRAHGQYAYIATGQANGIHRVNAWGTFK